jgi:hypothetical protein
LKKYKSLGKAVEVIVNSKDFVHEFGLWTAGVHSVCFGVFTLLCVHLVY